MDRRRLALSATARFAPFIVVLAVALFASAGTFDWPAGWAFLIVFTVLTVAVTIALIIKDPALTERRLAGGPTAERDPAQKLVQTFFMASWFGLLVLGGLDRRFGWTQAPSWVPVLGEVMFVAGFAGVWRVFRENSHAAAIVRVEAGQQVISTGPYALVRHPMYAAALPILAGMPLALGSAVGLLIFAAMVPMLIWRLTLEERLLVAELPGYEAYRGKVRWRLIPFVF